MAGAGLGRRIYRRFCRSGCDDEKAAAVTQLGLRDRRGDQRMRIQKQFREFTNNARFIVTANLNSCVIRVSLTHDGQGSRIVQNANVVFDTFALFGFGLGFYGPGIYRNAQSES